MLQKAGGVTRDTNLLGTYIYRLGIGGGDFGTAAAVAIFMLALTVVLTAPYVRAMLRQEDDVMMAAPRAARRPASAADARRPAGLRWSASFPVYWMVNTSLLPRREIRAPEPTWLPVRRHPRQLPAASSRATGSSTR